MPPSRARRAVLLVALGAASGLLAACATLAGGAPAAPACDAELLVSHYDADRIARFDGCSGAWLGDLRHDGELAGPQALRLGPDGLLYVVSERNDRILRFDPRTHAFVDVWLESPRLAAPTAIDFGADGAAFIGSYGGDRVLRFAGGELTDFLIGGDVDGVDAGMAFGPDGHLWIPAFESGVLLVVDPATRAVLRRIRTGLVNPRMLLWAPDGSYLLIGSWGNDAILSLDLTDPAAEPQPVLERLRPSGLAWMADGSLLTISDVRPPVYRVDLGATPPVITRFAEREDMAAMTYLLRIARQR